MILLVVDLTRRYRASGPGRRRQYRWLTLAATLLPVTILGTWISYALIGSADAVLAIGLGITYLALPTLIAVAVRRPDLFDADRALVATVTRSIILAGLLTVYTAVNALAGLVLSARSPAVAIAVTAGAAVLLAPLGRRLQRRVDARLYPARHAAFEAIADLHRETLLAQAGPEQLQQRLRDALADPTLVVGYCTPANGTIVDAQRRRCSRFPNRRSTSRSGPSASVSCRPVLRSPASSCAPSPPVPRLWSSWSGCASSCGRRSPRPRTAGHACSGSATRNGSVSSATCTTVPSNDWWRWGWRYGWPNAVSDAALTSPQSSTRPSPSSAPP